MVKYIDEYATRIYDEITRNGNNNRKEKRGMNTDRVNELVQEMTSFSNNLFSGKADDILVCICGMIAIRSVYRIGFRKDIDE